MSPVIQSLPVLILYPHSHCNCRCLMCDIWKETGKSEISAAELERHLTDIKQLRVQWVVLSGGEPLMHSDLFRFCAALRPLGIRTTILTTGLLLRPNAPRIVEHVDDIIVSLDGPPAVHDRIRRIKGAFEKITQGVQSIQELNPAFPISARCTIQRENHAVVSETARTAYALGLRSISFLAADLTSEAFNRPGGWSSDRQQSIALAEPEITELSDQFDQLSSEWNGTGFVTEDADKLHRILQHFRAHLGLCAPVSPNCNAPWNSAVVESDGAVRPCFFHRPIGRVNGMSLAQVLNGPEGVQFRLSLNVKNNPICQRCVCSLNWNPEKANRPSSQVNLQSPSVPQAAYFDSSQDAWVLSRYADVVAALHESRLRPVDSRAQETPSLGEMDAQSRLRTATLMAFPPQKLNLWRASLGELAHNIFGRLSARVDVDVVKRFAQPWCFEAALLVTEADRNASDRLNSLAREISMAAADPSDDELRQSATVANGQLADLLAASPIPMSGPAFTAISQTLCRFLANAWIALLHHPLQLQRLRKEPAFVPLAIEELFRYAGLAHTLFRRASARINLAGVTIEREERVALKLATANRDPLQFPHPEVLDISRQDGPHLALGIGSHSCAGGSLIRILARIATAEFVENIEALDTSRPIEWHGGSGFRSPKCLYVRMRQRTDAVSC